MKYCVILPYNRKLIYKDNVVIMNNIYEFLLAILAFLLGLLAVLKINKKRITNLFVVRWSKIYQSVDEEGRIYLKEERSRVEEKSMDAKLFVMAKVFKRQLVILLNELETEKTYKTKTHVLHTLQQAEKKKELKIHSYKKAEKRILIEAIWFLGKKDFFKLVFSKDRYKIYKQFYNVKFTRL